MSLDARAVANLILDNFESAKFSISNMKINKLVYFSHGFCLSRLGKPLVRNHFEAWQYGPVVRVLYESFKSFDAMPIETRANAFDYLSQQELPVNYSMIEPDQRELTLKVCGYFVNDSAERLSNISHHEDGPWASVWNTPKEARGMRDRIPNEIIREHFDKVWGKLSSTH
ncbi:MAG: type II toxin-antitoxin system antitoxin SocA domain-containing protein [Aestuariivirga sp.]